MFAPGVPDVMRDFNSSSDTLATFVVSIYLIGFAFGPLLIAPLSEIYGRYWVYMGGNIGFIIFAVACAVSKNLGQLIAFHFLHGVAGVTPLTIGGGTIADMMPVEKRGGAMAFDGMLIVQRYDENGSSKIMTLDKGRLALYHVLSI
jgi:MFS family permease